MSTERLASTQLNGSLQNSLIRFNNCRSGLCGQSIIAAIFIQILFSGAVLAGPVDDLQSGHWYEAPNSNLSQVFPDPVPYGYNGPQSVMQTWCGGAYDSKRDRLIVWGGGHMDYSGNEVYVFDIETLTWIRLDEPTSEAEVIPNAPDGRYADGRPASRHTYGYLQYAPNVDLFFSLGFASVYGDPGNSGHEVDAYNFDARTWSPRATKPNNGVTIGAWSAYDPSTGLLWHHGTFNGELASYNPINDQWVHHQKSGQFFEFDSTAAIDPERQLMVAVGANQFFVWDLSDPDAPPTSPVTSGTGLENTYAPGFEYDPVIKKFVGWNGGSQLYILNPEDWSWSLHSPAVTNTVTPTSAESHGTYGRFRYIPSKNAYIVVNRTNENVYFYKLSTGGGSTPGPSVFLTSNALTVAIGGSIDLSWGSTNADNCIATGDWGGIKITSGSESVGPINESSIFVLSCSNNDGVVNSSVTVTVDATSVTDTGENNNNTDGSSTTNSTNGDSDGGGTFGWLTMIMLLAVMVRRRIQTSHSIPNLDVGSTGGMNIIPVLPIKHS